MVWVVWMLRVPTVGSRYSREIALILLSMLSIASAHLMISSHWGDAMQMLATTLEDPHSQLALQQANLFADPRLTGEERIGSHGHIEVVVPDRDQILQLL